MLESISKNKLTRALIIEAFAFAFALVMVIAFTTPAYGTTLAEYDAMIAEQQKIVDQKNAELDKINEKLARTAAWMYKNASTEDMLNKVVSSTGFEDAVENLKQVEKITEQYKQQQREAIEAKNAAVNSQNEIGMLRQQYIAQKRSLENRKGIQFCQGGDNAWSRLRYWGGNVAGWGCGLVSYTVMVDVLTGAEYNPADMLDIRGDWYGMDGYADDCTGSGSQTHAEWTEEVFGIKSWALDKDIDVVRSELNNNETVIIVVAAGSSFKNPEGGWRWSDGHFVAITGYNDGEYYVADSALSDGTGCVMYSEDDMQRLLRGTTKGVVYRN